MQNNINKIFFKSVLSLSLLSTIANASDDKVLLENSWVNIGDSNAKDVMMGGATTATAKGASAMFTNPAGLSTNYALGLYINTAQQEHKNATGSGSEENDLVKTSEILPADNMTIGLFYKSLIVEVKADKHIAAGLAYGLETNYGLFSVGANYVADTTTEENYKDFGTGNYYIGGFQWQKSFINIDDFYAFYFGISQKGQGIKEFEDEIVYRLSPIVQRVGFGFETNVFASSILVSVDQTTQSWHHFDDTLSTTALGLKWMMFDGLSFALGYSQSTYTTEVTHLDTATTLSGGVEFSIWNLNVALAGLQKEVLNDTSEVYIQENSIHADVSFAF